MKIIPKNHKTFELNGVEETILSRPKTRSEAIKFTMNGKREFAQELPIEVFEFNTNCYLEGLEPEREVDQKKHFNRLVDFLRENDFTVKIDSNGEIESHITFTNTTNSKIGVILHTMHPKDGDPVIYVGKKVYGMQLENLNTNKNNYDLQVDRAIELVSKFTSQKVQVISIEVDKDSEREYDKNGIPILKAGESLDDYFKDIRENKHAGIVLTSNKDKYMPFYSFDTAGGRILSHNTKSYKTVKGAEKFLDKLGYDGKGRVKESVFDIDDVKNALVEYSRRMISLTESSDYTAEAQLNNGYILYNQPIVVQDENLGARCFVDFEYVRESDGHKYKDSIEVTYDDSGYYAVKSPIFVHANAIERELESGELQYPEDTRTKGERSQYHKKVIKKCMEDISQYQEWKQERSNYDFYEKRITELEDRAEQHRKSLKEIKLEKGTSELDF